MKFSLLLISSIISVNLSAQYGSQLDNRGFEEWTSREENAVDEPVHWHSGGTATGTFSGFVSNQIEVSTQTRPGTSGSKSVRVFPTSIFGITANGNLTNGRMNAGSMSATCSENYNYTQRSSGAFNSPVSMIPDSLTLWVCFRSQSATDKAQIQAVVHGDADYKLIADGTEEPANMKVASALSAFTRTAPANGTYTWRRMSIPFTQNGPCTDPRYLLFTATTNESPGSGSTDDDLFIDDISLIYNPVLTLGTLPKTNFTPNEWFVLSFTLTGTMSPENLNVGRNEIIAQLSDANGSFDNPQEMGRAFANESGSFMVQIPNVTNGQHYKVRVVSTNYPMIGQNIQGICIEDNTGFEELTTSCSIFPNPFSTQLGIAAEKTAKNIRIFDVYGRLLKEQTADSQRIELDLSELNNGIYLLQLDYGDTKSNHRIIKAD